jgi:membrane protease YdiL (CAAX protease family)
MLVIWPIGQASADYSKEPGPVLKICNELNRILRSWIVTRAARQVLSTAALSAALVAYSNVDAWLELRANRPVPARVNFSHLSVLACVLAWAGADRLTLRDLGIRSGTVGRSLGWGLAAGAFGSAVVAIFFAFPLVSRDAVTHPDFRGLSLRRILWMLVGQILLSTAVFEEVTFRGVLQAKLTRLLAPRPAVLVGGALFAAWHLAITWYNLRRSNLPRRWFAPLYVGALATFWVAGVIFGLLRQRTGSLAGGILAHWLVVSNIVLAVARPRRPPV